MTYFKLKRKVQLIILFVLFLLPISISAKVYDVYDMRIDIDNNKYEVFIGNDVKNNYDTDKTVYLIAEDSDEEKYIIVFVDSSGLINNIENYLEEDINPLIKKWEKGLNSKTSKVYNLNGYKYINIEYKIEDEYGISYSTIINKKLYSIRFQQNKKITNEDKENIKEIINNIEFKRKEKKEYNILDLKIDFEKDWAVVEKNDIEILSEENELKSYMNQNFIYLVGSEYLEDKRIEISILDDKSYFVYNLKNEKDNKIKELEDKLLTIKGTNLHGIYENKNYKYIYLEYYDDFNEYTIDYYTIVNERIYKIGFHQSNKFTDERRKKTKEKLDTIIFTDYPYIYSALDLSLKFKKNNWVVLTRENFVDKMSENNEVQEEQKLIYNKNNIPVIEKKAMDEYMISFEDWEKFFIENKNIYFVAKLLETPNLEFSVSVINIKDYKIFNGILKLTKINNISDFNDDEINKLKNKIVESNNANKSEIVSINNYKFISIEFFENGNYFLDYYTIINKKLYTIRFQKSEEFINDDKLVIKDIINDVSFLKDDNYNNHKITLIIYLIIITFLVIVFMIVKLVIIKK